MQEISYFFQLGISGHLRVSAVCCHLQADRRRGDLSVPSGSRSPAGPTRKLHGLLGLHKKDMEVRTNARVLQRACAISRARHAQHMPGHDNLREVHTLVRRRRLTNLCSKSDEEKTKKQFHFN